MVKIAIKSEELSPFGGIFRVNHPFSHEYQSLCSLASPQSTQTISPFLEEAVMYTLSQYHF